MNSGAFSEHLLVASVPRSCLLGAYIFSTGRLKLSGGIADEAAA